jgi:hypothetical protein
MSRFTLPLILLFLGGTMVGVSASLKDLFPLVSSVLFFLGYATDAIAIAFIFYILFKRR